MTEHGLQNDPEFLRLIIQEQKDEIEALRKNLEAAQAAIGAALSSVHYMDNPDGGSISIEDQLLRMAKDAERYRFLRDDAFENSDDCFMDAGRLFAEKHGVTFDSVIDAALAVAPDPK